MILYLHGFRSSPQSFKARAMQSYLSAQGLGDAFSCPALSADPAAAIARCDELIAQAQQAGKSVTLVGSSLGGYYATWLGERHNLRAVLINPAVLAHVSLADYLGTQTNLYTGERFEFTLDHIDALRRIEVAAPNPARYFLLLEKGDEVLDWRQAAERYAGCRQVVLDGGDHSFTRFGEYLPAILEFAGMASAAVSAPTGAAHPARL